MCGRSCRAHMELLIIHPDLESRKILVYHPYRWFHIIFNGTQCYIKCIIFFYQILSIFNFFFSSKPTINLIRNYVKPFHTNDIQEAPPFKMDIEERGQPQRSGRTRGKYNHRCIEYLLIEYYSNMYLLKITWNLDSGRSKWNNSLTSSTVSVTDCCQLVSGLQSIHSSPDLIISFPFLVFSLFFSSPKPSMPYKGKPEKPDFFFLSFRNPNKKRKMKRERS